VRRILNMGLLVSTLLATGAWNYPQSPAPERHRVDAEIGRALHDLDQIEQSLRYGDRRDTERELGEIRERLNNIRALVDGAAPVTNRGPALTEEIFAPLVQKLSITWNPQARMSIITTLATKPYELTIAQVTELTQFFYAEPERVHVIELLAPHVCDPESYGRLQAVVRSPGARNTVAQLFVRPDMY
jgi:uncharacterized protein DUF4476